MQYRTYESVSFITVYAAAVRRMVDDVTLGVFTAGVDTWIGTLLLKAGLVERTFVIDNTFWPAVWRFSDIVGDA